MWWKKMRERREKLNQLEREADERVERSRILAAHSVRQARASESVADRSAKLHQANNIASIIARSLGMPSTSRRAHDS